MAMLDNTFFGLTGSPDAIRTEDQANELLKRLQMAAAAGTGQGQAFPETFQPSLGGMAVTMPDDRGMSALPRADSENPQTIAPSIDSRYPDSPPPVGPSTTSRPQPQVSSAPPMRRAGNIPVPAPAASAGGGAPVVPAQSPDFNLSFGERMQHFGNALTGRETGSVDEMVRGRKTAYDAMIALGADPTVAKAAAMNPKILELMMASKLGTKGQPEWGVIGEDRFGKKQYGFIDRAGSKVTPYNPTGEVAASNASEDLTGEEFLATLPKQEQTQIKALVEGRLRPPPMGRKNPYWEQLLAKAGQYEPGFDMTVYNTRQQAAKTFSSGIEGRNISQLNTALNHMADLNEKIDGLGNMSYLPILNKPMNLVRAQTDPEYAKKRSEFSTNRQTAITEIAKAIRGVGAMTQSELHEWESKFNDDSSPEVMKGALQEAVRLLQGRMEPLADQYNKAMGKSITGDDLLSPKARQHAKDILGVIEEPKTEAPAEPGQTQFKGVPEKPPANAPKLPDGSVVIRNPNYNPKLPISNSNPKFLRHTE